MEDGIKQKTLYKIIDIDKLLQDLPLLYRDIEYSYDDKYLTLDKNHKQISKDIIYAIYRNITTQYRNKIYHTVSMKHAVYAIRKAITAGYTYVVKTDIKRYYKQISPYMLEMYNPGMYAKIHNIFKDKTKMLFYNKTSLIPGYPHSAVIAQILSSGLRKWLYSLIYNIQTLKSSLYVIQIIVYYDDIMIFLKSKSDADKILQKIKTNIKFELNEDKTRIIDLKKEAPILLGLRIIADKPDPIRIPRDKWANVKRSRNRHEINGYYGYLSSIVDTSHYQLNKVMIKLNNFNKGEK